MTSTLGIKKIQYPNGTNSITIDSSGSAAITTANITTAAITTANVTNATATGTITTPSINGSQISGRRNIVINGAMKVAQRATSATGVGASTAYPTLDRMKIVASTSGRATMSQVAVTDLPGFANALKLECTTADTSISSGEYFLLRQCFEGQDLQQFKKGTSSAEKVTVSFYVKGNASATYQVELQDADNNRYAGQTFSVTTSWNRVSLTFVGDTSGVFNDDANESLRLNIWLHAGATYTGGTFTSNTWQTTDNQRLDDITSFLDSTSRTIFVTGWQMEVGSQVTAFEHKSFGEELALCQRYFCQFTDPSSMIGIGGYQRNDFADVSVQFPVPMRTAPSLVQTSGSNYYGITRHDNNENFNSFVTAFGSSNKNMLLYVGSGLSGTQGSSARFYTSANGSIAFNAEL